MEYTEEMKKALEQHERKEIQYFVKLNGYQEDQDTEKFKIECPTCKGQGVVFSATDPKSKSDIPELIETPCTKCGGSGKVINRKLQAAVSQYKDPKIKRFAETLEAPETNETNSAVINALMELKSMAAGAELLSEHLETLIESAKAEYTKLSERPILSKTDIYRMIKGEQPTTNQDRTNEFTNIGFYNGTVWNWRSSFRPENFTKEELWVIYQNLNKNRI